MVETTSDPVVSTPDAKLSQRALGALGKLPPFSPILNKLLASLAQDDVSFVKLGDLIEKDPVVAGNLLHLVNSALYARRGSINSVRHALSLLGINKLRNVVLGMSITRMWNQVKTPASWSMARFNMHSAASGILSDLLAQRLTVHYAEGAFVAGLLVLPLLLAGEIYDYQDTVDGVRLPSVDAIVVLAGGSDPSDPNGGGGGGQVVAESGGGGGDDAGAAAPFLTSIAAHSG